MFPDGSPLRQEYGKALSCHERALLFAADSTLIGTIKARPEPPNIIFPPPRNLDDLIRCRHITRLYIEAFELLSDRWTKVIVQYANYSNDIKRLGRFKFSLSNCLLRWVPIQVGDRDEKSTDESGELVRARFGALVSFIRKRNAELKRNFVANPAAVLDFKLRQYYKRDWEGLNSICRLLMEEITFLQNRIDNFITVSISHASLRNAILAIWVSIVLTGFGMVLSSHKHKTPGNGDIHKVAKALGKINTNVKRIPKAIAAHAENETLLSGSATSAIAGQLEQINTNLKNISDTSKTSPQQEQAIAILQPEITAINQEISALASATNSKLTSIVPPPNLAPILDKLDEIKGAVNSLADTIKQKESVPSATPEESELHGWGVGYLRFRPSKVAH